jgi:hypothetical protein
MTMRLPLTVTRLLLMRGADRVLVAINVLSVSDLVHGDGLAIDPEAEAVFAGPHALPTGEVAGKRLGGAASGLMLQAMEQLHDAKLNHVRHPFKLLLGIRREEDGCHDSVLRCGQGKSRSLTRQRLHGLLKIGGTQGFARFFAGFLAALVGPATAGLPLAAGGGFSAAGSAFTVRGRPVFLGLFAFNASTALRGNSISLLPTRRPGK